ncbi:MAG: acyl-CoA thioesterase [Bacteroidales bacterium]|jgi:acyl-CoA thioester hydrolase|nr:acyl-CoA thioesterase [Bacteroidales bacterium]
MKHVSKLIVRSYECDAYSHVNNAVYLNYLEFARMEFLKDNSFDYKRFVDFGYAIVIVRVVIDYKLSAVLDDELTIETEPVKRRAVSGMFHQRILKGDALVAQADVTWAILNGDGKLSPIPEEFDISALNP